EPARGFADGVPSAPAGRLPLPGEADWPGARSQREPAPAPAPEPEPARDVPPPAGSVLDEAPRHAKPMVPSQHTAATFVPTDDPVAETPLASRAGIAQQALAELSQLSTYRPQAMGAAAPLTRRTPTPIPQAAPAAPARRGSPRDANQVRSLLASFQSGTVRGREEAGSAPGDGKRG
ncbi:MAG TPA: hypothetical protein PKB06_04795, partial [Actinotalea sp.]|nr:hypothetical protein [Actinotalea sp.]